MLKNIRRKPFDMKALRLSPEEGFVLSRLDSPMSVKELVDLTGLDQERIVSIVEVLTSQGVVELDRDPAAAAAPATTAEPDPQEPETTDAGEAEADSASGDSDSDSDGDEEAEETADQAEKRAAGAREYQRLYETVYRHLERDARIAAATTASGPDLLALCYDPEPQVIHALLGNARATVDVARMVAQHHRTHIGLDHVGRRTELISDAQVQRRLLTNPQLPETLLRKIVSPKLLTDVYKIAANREIPERSRLLTRELLQKKFMLASPDERTALLVRTEGRCLASLVNCALDARTTQMLTSKTSYTVLFIQNLARWSATPPALLAHLLKQPVVRQNMGLKKMLLKHRNVSSDTKRSMS